MAYEGAKKMLMDSRYPFDKVIKLLSTSFSMPGSSTQTFAFPHGLPFTPLCNGAWSTSPTFAIQYEFSSGVFPSSFPGVVYNIIFNVFADATNIYITGDNLVGTTTIYVRVFGFEPPNSQASIAGIASQGDEYVIDSRLNYPKLFLNDYIDLPAGGATDQFVYIDHGIGTIPQAMGWVTYNTYNGSQVVSAIHPISTTNTSSEGITLIVGDERIAFGVPAFVDPHRAYYRIYLDE